MTLFLLISCCVLCVFVHDFCRFFSPQAKAATEGDPDAGSIPEIVSNRMLSRMVRGGGRVVDADRGGTQKLMSPIAVGDDEGDEDDRRIGHGPRMDNEDSGRDDIYL